MQTYDFIAIGGGSAGIASANRAAEYGKKALIIEEKAVGGTCVNVGCVPKKIMWYGSQLNEDIKRFGPEYGIQVDNQTLDFETLRKSREAYIDRVHNSYFSGFESRGTDFIEGHANFIDNHIVEVNGEQYYGEHIAVVTGGRARLLDIPGIEHVDVSDDFFAWETLPKSVVLIGAGYIAVELAGVLNGLGVETTLAVRKERPLRDYEPTIIDALTEEMQAVGVKILTHHNVAEIVKNNDDQLTVNFQEGDSLTAEKVIYAIGREPNTDKLAIENTDIALDDKGFIKVNDYHETNVPGVYAFGDVIGKVELTPVAIKAGRTLSDHLFNGADKFYIDYDMIPTVIFSHPPIGVMGYTEAQAKEKFGADKVKTYESSFADMYSAATSNRRTVKMKLVVVGDEERVVGLHGIGFGMDEILQGFAVAINMGATKAQFDQTIAIHPTGAEEFVTMK